MDERDEMIKEMERYEKGIIVGGILTIILLVTVVGLLIKLIITALNPEAPEEERRMARRALLFLAFLVPAIVLLVVMNNPHGTKIFLLEAIRSPFMATTFFVIFFCFHNGRYSIKSNLLFALQGF